MSPLLHPASRPDFLLDMPPNEDSGWVVKLKVVHLIRRMERIDRDLEELENFQNTIHQDREYAVRLRDSLVEESMRLKKLKGRILSQVIRTPERETGESLNSLSRPSREHSRIAMPRRADKVEILIPGKPKSAAESQIRGPEIPPSTGGNRETVTSRSSERNTPEKDTRGMAEKARSADGPGRGGTKHPPFKFVFQTKESSD